MRIERLIDFARRSRKRASYWLAVIATWVVCILGLYGFQSWYFPSRMTWILVAPLGVIGFALAIWICHRTLHLQPTKMRKVGAIVFTFLLVPLGICVAFGVGLPAAAMRLSGPNSQIEVTVVDKRERFKRCRKQLLIAEYSHAFKDRLCVSSREFDSIREGQRVLLVARQGTFGTFVFSIKPS